jgi:hypothetical protein
MTNLHCNFIECFNAAPITQQALFCAVVTVSFLVLTVIICNLLDNNN